MLIFSVFKTLTGQEVTIELKNDLAIQGTLASVDQFLNLKLENIKVLDQERHPHMMAVKNCFIRGSVVRYVQIPKAAVDTQLLEDATRKGTSQSYKENPSDNYFGKHSFTSISLLYFNNVLKFHRSCKYC